MTLEILKPTTAWAFLTVHNERNDTATYWTFATIENTHKAEAIIEAAEGYSFDRRRASEMTPKELRAAFEHRRCVVDNLEDLEMLVSGREYMLDFA